MTMILNKYFDANWRIGIPLLGLNTFPKVLNFREVVSNYLVEQRFPVIVKMCR
jgi:hypothetical protein